ncbi:MAG: hypothetical protein Gaeavirus23_9 [Gaeavirus sp.]|uniref:Uncharacterized protein n=1 Tax=Gaeavirus sp. TaxID=2487767 RepID=A0A3G4ZZH9_9VIRU|nr:MAG: hypothetical protein Gaeavirus23_9 [Gaeavirus sp.]
MSHKLLRAIELNLSSRTVIREFKNNYIPLSSIADDKLIKCIKADTYSWAKVIHTHGTIDDYKYLKVEQFSRSSLGTIRCLGGAFISTLGMCLSLDDGPGYMILAPIGVISMFYGSLNNDDSAVLKTCISEIERLQNQEKFDKE